MSPVTPLTTVGHPTPRIDALERVTGKAKYTLDVQLPGMLCAARTPTPASVASTSRRRASSPA
jgi:CO/xanthine dehydrogenase Mo-binding subunit